MLSFDNWTAGSLDRLLENQNDRSETSTATFRQPTFHDLLKRLIHLIEQETETINKVIKCLKISWALIIIILIISLYAAFK